MPFGSGIVYQKHYIYTNSVLVELAIQHVNNFFCVDNLRLVFFRMKYVWNVNGVQINIENIFIVDKYALIVHDSPTVESKW